MRHKPFARGVSQLMYVGDDGTSGPAAAAMPSNTELAAGAVAALVAYKSKGIVQLAAAAVAGWVGYSAYQAYRAAQAPAPAPSGPVSTPAPQTVVVNCPPGATC